MTKRGDLTAAVTHAVSGKVAKGAKKAVPGGSLVDGIQRMHQAHSDYQKLREEERTKRLAILADRDVTIERIRAQHDTIKTALADTFNLRKTGLEAQIRAMDKALESGNVAALHVVLDGMVKTIQSSPFKDIADMREKFSDQDFVLRLK
ncbi:hypothetical protein [Achromobacter sp.]|uniref:hypothetical protein n=1 Tax=Achromobacter sp. TaxID=134375 RepID=UPI0028AAAE2A|nr:hypothetical protein [Achromobacter sp.]